MKGRSKFDYSNFYGDGNYIAVSKQKYSIEQAQEIASIELGDTNESEFSIGVKDCFVRHGAGIDDDGNKRVCWWLEDFERKTSCPVWCFYRMSGESK